jgi:hypothetical protein
VAGSYIEAILNLEARRQWLTPVILATWETEMQRPKASLGK